MPPSTVPSEPAPGLPDDADGVLALAAQSMFDVFARAAMGMMVVDRSHRIVWISEGYKRFLPALGHDEGDFVGRLVEEVVPNTQMARVIDTGQPIVVDLLTNKAGTFLVSRLPLRDAHGEVIGAIGMVLLDHPETTMQPLIEKFSRLQRELDAARQQLAAQRRPKYTLASFIGTSEAAIEIKRQARRASQTGSPVLLHGETGTGKELLAHGIHAASPRVARPFIGVNIAAVPETLLEAEFFGVAPGAYTGADRKGRDGKFKLADGGTLFLDEIGDMPQALQPKLLRVLQEQELEPLGSNTVLKVDVRVIAATSRDLKAMVAQGQFREDLYYRLHVLPLRVPPLRERLSDLEPLGEVLCDDIARRSGLPQRHLSADALERLAQYDWPGNIRELRNLLEQVAMLTDDLRLEARHFDRVLPQVKSAGACSSQATAIDTGAASPIAAPTPLEPGGEASVRALPQAIAELEQRSIEAALRATAGNKLAAARLLGISRATLYEKLAAAERPATDPPKSRRRAQRWPA